VIEIANDNGEFVPFEFIDPAVRIELEWALMNGAPVTVLEVN
jgi:hypothetical protein